MSPSFSDAVARAAVSSGFPVYRKHRAEVTERLHLLPRWTRRTQQDIRRGKRDINGTLFLVHIPKRALRPLTCSFRVCRVRWHFLVCVFFSKQLAKNATNTARPCYRNNSERLNQLLHTSQRWFYKKKSLTWRGIWPRRCSEWAQTVCFLSYILGRSSGWASVGTRSIRSVPAGGGNSSDVTGNTTNSFSAFWKEKHGAPFWWRWLDPGIQQCRSQSEECQQPNTSCSRGSEQLGRNFLLLFYFSWPKATCLNHQVMWGYLCYPGRSSPAWTFWRTPRCNRGCWRQKKKRNWWKTISWWNLIQTKGSSLHDAVMVGCDVCAGAELQGALLRHLKPSGPNTDW